MNVTHQHCPYLDCGSPICNPKPGLLGFCDECRGPIMLCPQCLCPNRLWAAYCRACGRKIQGRDNAIRKYRPSFSDKASGLYCRQSVEAHPSGRWDGELQVVSGSVLIFSGSRGAVFNRVQILHPHMDVAPFDVIGKSDQTGRELYGAAAICGTHIYIASSAGLVRVACASFSGETAFQPDQALKFLPFVCDNILDIDSKRLILVSGKGSNQQRRLQIFNIATQEVGETAEAQGNIFSVAQETLLSVGDGIISAYDVAPCQEKPILKECLEIAPWQCESKPVLIGGNVYLLAKRSRGGQKALLKWELNGGPSSIREYRVVMECDEFQGVWALADKYMIANSNEVKIHDVAFDQVHQSINPGSSIHNAKHIIANTPLVAIPFANRPNATSVTVVDGLSGQYLFTTKPFFKIFSLRLWGRFLYVLAQHGQDEAVEFFSYDMKEAINASRE